MRRRRCESERAAGVCAIWGRLGNAVAARIEQTIAPVAPQIAQQLPETAPKLQAEASEIDVMNAARKRKAAGRQAEILRIVTSKTLTVSELASEVGSSDNTVRSDLRVLQEAGHGITVNGVVKLI